MFIGAKAVGLQPPAPLFHPLPQRHRIGSVFVHLSERSCFGHYPGVQCEPVGPMLPRPGPLLLHCPGDQHLVLPGAQQQETGAE